MKYFLISFYVFCVILVLLVAPNQLISSSYKRGDCLIVDGENKILQVRDVGKYGLKVIRISSFGEGRYVDDFVSPYEMKKATKMDCFDFFDKGVE